MVDISLILPTRERLPQLQRVLESAASTADRPERLEIVLYLDDDDIPSHEFTFPKLNLVPLIRPSVAMGQMTNSCYEASTGRYIMLANDDIVFRTPDWDTTVLETFGAFPDEVALVWGNDLYYGRSELPFLSRSVCQIMGHVCPPEYKQIFIDNHIYDIFRRLHSLGHNRMRFLPDMIIEHMHVQAGKTEPDKTYVKHHPEDDERTYIAWDEERQLIASDLAGHIEQFESQLHSKETKRNSLLLSDDQKTA